MPLHISGMAKLRWNWMIAKPSPLKLPNSSLMTIRMIEIDSAWRMPATICGLAEGSTRWRSLAAPLIPILFLFAGIGDTAKIIVIVFGAMWPVLLNTVEGVRATDSTLADTCRSYGITGTARLRHLVLRSASPQIVTGMRQALSIAVILMVISEMFASDNGIGYAVLDFQRSFAIPEMWSGILLLGILGVVLSVLFRVFEQRTLAWYYGLRRAQRDGS